jgi:nitroimidazol reductase NimA-like FMN-containing flavoprotein (pyridoxamine 5'-phosphate oxidase superfamily)
MTPDSMGMEVLTRAECLDLLRSCPVGRVAVTRPGAAPLVVPVNFVLDRDVIVFRTASGTKLDGLRVGPIGFQIDAIEPFRRSGWSVYVEGPAYEATPAEVAHLDLAPWAPGVKDRWIRLPATRISGRRLREPLLILDVRAYL